MYVYVMNSEILIKLDSFGVMKQKDRICWEWFSISKLSQCKTAEYIHC